MARELIGVVVNPRKKRKSKRKTSSRRRSSKRVRTLKLGRKKLVIISNPSHDQKALIELAMGAATGLAGGKLLDRAIFNQMRFHVPFGISLGDVTVLAGGLFLLKKGGKGNEFATGVVAGAGAKILLNTIDALLFKNRGVVSLHGEDYAMEPAVEPEELDPELLEGEQVAELGYESPIDDEVLEPEEPVATL